MQNKPDKLCIKFWIPVDVDSKFTCVDFPFLEKDNQEVKLKSFLKYSNAFLNPYLNTNRTVAADNYSSSLSLLKVFKKTKTNKKLNFLFNNIYF